MVTYRFKMNWQRARTDENKNERKEAICAAAFTLFVKNGYEKVSFNGIALQAGFTKSNMYRYFSSKEEIFLKIFSELFNQWFESYTKRLKKLDENTDIKQFANAWVQSFKALPQFLDLVPILFVSLEKNSSYEQLVEFKKMSKYLLYNITVEVSRIYPDIQTEKAFKFLSLSYAATSNYWAGASQNEVLKKVYEQDVFKEMKPDFEKDLTSAVEIIVLGLKAYK